MKLKFLLFALLSLLTLGISGCGSDADGLNGAIEVEAEAVGSVISATATYTNPTEENRIGVPITFIYRRGGFEQELGTFSTNNSGSVGVSFTPARFSGTQTVTIIARTGNLTDFASFAMVGSALTVTPPPAVTATTDLPADTQVTISIPAAASFVTTTDPFATDISGRTLTVTAADSSADAFDTVTAPAATTTDASGRISFPGTTATMRVPAAGTSRSMTVTWTVSDTITGQTSTSSTLITLSKPAATTL
jgi:hypothetical protein